MSSLATPRGRRWIVLCVGFTIATLQLCGLALIEPSLFNFVNVGIVLFFYGLTWSLIPVGGNRREDPLVAKEQSVLLKDGVAKVKGFRQSGEGRLYQIELDRQGKQTTLLVSEPQMKQMLAQEG